MIEQHQLLPLLCSLRLFFLIPFLESVTQSQTKNWLAGLKKKKNHKITKPLSSPVCSCRRCNCWRTPHWPWWYMSQQPACCRRAAQPEESSWRMMTAQHSKPEKKSWGPDARSCRRSWTDWSKGTTWRRNPRQHCEGSLRETEGGKDETKKSWSSFEKRVPVKLFLAVFYILTLCPRWLLCSLTINTGGCLGSYLEFESEGGGLRGREVLHVWTAGARWRHTDLISVGLPEGAVTDCSQPAYTIKV